MMATVNTKQQKKEESLLLSKGWEHVMTEEDGCDTWTLPHLLRKNWPHWAQRLHGTQCYWDRDEAMELQREIDGPKVKIDRYQGQHNLLLKECTRHHDKLNLAIPQWSDMSDTERVRWTIKIMAEEIASLRAWAEFVQTFPDEHVAWLVYKRHQNGNTTIRVCNSDTPGAFKVWKRPENVNLKGER